MTIKRLSVVYRSRFVSKWLHWKFTKNLVFRGYLDFGIADKGLWTHTYCVRLSFSIAMCKYIITLLVVKVPWLTWLYSWGKYQEWNVFWWLSKQILVYTYNGILLSSKNDETMCACNNMDESQRHYAKWKKLDSKGYILPWKEIKYWYMLQLEWTLKTLCSVKEPDTKDHILSDSIYMKYPE